jgi:hypothetical protein
MSEKQKKVNPKPNLSLEKYSHASIYPRGSRPVLEVPKSFSFVLNVSSIEGGSAESGIMVSPGLTLRRASIGEVAAIRDVLEREAGNKNLVPWQNSTKKESDDHTSYPVLPKEEWRYFVIDFEGSNLEIAEFEQTLSVADVELKLGFTVLKEAFVGTNIPTLLFDPARLFSQVQRTVRGDLQFVVMNPSIASDISALDQTIKAYDAKVINIERLSKQLLELDALPYASPLLFLGYFAILESLLTHQPDAKDTIDSITRQVKRKLMLLDNRWKPPLDYAPFKGGTPESVWNKMYAYRSALAHGSEPDFKGNLNLLGDHRAALSLLRQAVKSVLRQAVAEPLLIRDLRDC